MGFVRVGTRRQNKVNTKGIEKLTNITICFLTDILLYKMEICNGNGPTAFDNLIWKIHLFKVFIQPPAKVDFVFPTGLSVVVEEKAITGGKARGWKIAHKCLSWNRAHIRTWIRESFPGRLRMSACDSFSSCWVRASACSFWLLHHSLFLF